MTSPAALMSPKTAVSEVMKLAKALGISVVGIGSKTTPDGARQVTWPESVPRNNFPFTFDKVAQTITIPGIYVDFVTWQYLPPQTITGGPPANGDAWLRVTVPASFDHDNPIDFWATVNIGNARLEWVDHATADPPPIGFVATFIENSTQTEWCRYIIRVTNHNAVAYAMETGIVTGFPL
jgi:hypothetical protein